MLGRDGEQELAGHDVVAELVHAADEVGQRLGPPHRQASRPRRHLIFAQRSVDASAHASPQRLDHAEGVGGRLGEAALQLERAACDRVVAPEANRVAVASRQDLQSHLVLTSAAAPVHQLETILDLDARAWRIEGHVNPSCMSVRPEPEIRGLEVDGQRRWHRVVAAVGAPIERPGVDRRRLEVGVVRDQIAGHLAQAHRTQPRQQLPKLLGDEKRITSTLQIEIAV